MNQHEQQAIWSQRTATATVQQILDGCANPCAFQSEFVEYVNRLGESLHAGRKLRICEMGSELGVTTLLLDGRVFERHAVDLNPHPMELLAQAASEAGQEISVHVKDMFRTGWPDETFDVVFSNGVLEHYDWGERASALKECFRLTRNGGFVLIGVPNHCSLPYRFAYLLRRLLGRWPYPPEEKIETLTRELSEIRSLHLQRTLLLDQETVFAILPKSRVTAVPFRLLHRWMKFEPYLRVFQLIREDAPRE